MGWGRELLHPVRSIRKNCYRPYHSMRELLEEAGGRRGGGEREGAGGGGGSGGRVDSSPQQQNGGEISMRGNNGSGKLNYDGRGRVALAECRDKRQGWGGWFWMRFRTSHCVPVGLRQRNHPDGSVGIYFERVRSGRRVRRGCDGGMCGEG